MMEYLISGAPNKFDTSSRGSRFVYLSFDVLLPTLAICRDVRAIDGPWSRHVILKSQ